MVVGLLAAIYRAPVVATAPVFCMFGLEQWAQAMVPLFVQFHKLTNLLAGSMVVLALLLMYLRGRDIALNYSTAGWLVLLLFFYAFISLLWAPNTATGISLWKFSLPYVVTILVFGPLLISRIADFQRMCWSTLFLGAPVVVLILAFANWEGRFIVLEGEGLGNPLAIAQVAGYVALAAIFLHFGTLPVLLRVLRWGLVAACLMLAVKSGSRGQFYGVLLIAPVLLLFASPSRGMRGAFWSAAGIGAMLVLGQWALTNFAEESNRWSSQEIRDVTVEGRWTHAGMMLEHWYSTPEVFYFGLGNSASYHYLGGYSHVAPLEILAEEGLVGFGLFLAIVYLATRSLIRVYNVVKYDAANRGALLTLASWFFYELFLSCKQGSLLGSLLLFLFAALLNRYEGMVVTRSILSPRAMPAYRGNRGG